MKEFLKIPCSEQRLVDGSVVILDRFPNTKWIVHNGWYTYQNVRYNGWYFSSIPSRTILPCSDRDLRHLVVISGGDCGCDCKPEPPHPHPPQPEPGPHPPRPKPPIDDCHNPQKYYGGVHYPAGALIYLEYGDIYQATCNFRSSWNGASVADNLKADIQSGYLVKIPDTVANKLNERIDSAFHELDETNERIDDVETIRFVFNFSEVFEGEIGEDGVLTRAMAERYLDLLDPPIKPRIGIYFKNTDKNSPTAGHVFTYYTHPSDSSKLIFIDDTVDNKTNLDDVVKKSESKSLCDGLEVTGTGDGIIAATNFTEYAGADSLLDKQKSKNWAVSLDDMGAFSKEAANNKLDKVSSAVENHVAVFDADGNIKDAGEGIPDLEPKMDKVKTAVEGHIAVFDATGNVIDSGKTLDDMTPKWVDYDSEEE